MESQSISTGTQILQYSLTGITTGSIYALVALGFNMIYNVTEIINFAQGEFVVLGGLFVLRWPRLAWLHLPAAAWGAWVECAGWVCPLTYLENWLRTRAGLAGYESSFLERTLSPVLYPASLTQEIQWGLGIGVLAINAAIYAWALRARSRREQRSSR